MEWQGDDHDNLQDGRGDPQQTLRQQTIPGERRPRPAATLRSCASSTAFMFQ